MKKAILILSVLINLGFAGVAFSQETVNFKDFVKEKLSKSQKIVTENGKQKIITGIKLSEVCDIDNDPIAMRVFADYGAIFVAGGGVLFPTKCIFANETEVRAYQSNAGSKSAEIGGVLIELQEPAMNALLEAQKEAAKKNLKITVRDGAEGGARSYEKTVELWNSRFFPALNYWVQKGKIAPGDAAAAKAMPIQRQVAQVLKWEEKKLWFSTNRSISIFYSTAPPGASQHVFMLALDVEQYGNKQIRDILAKYGWFQTVKNDLTHFTYLGLEKSDLPKHGLKRKVIGGQEFWIPNMD